MPTTQGVTPGGAQSSAQQLQQWELQEQQQQALFTAQSTVEEGWIAALNQVTQHYATA
jgi:hypothetical protein